jgi:hypothetical protein
MVENEGENRSGATGQFISISINALFMQTNVVKQLLHFGKGEYFWRVTEHYSIMSTHIKYITDANLVLWFAAGVHGIISAFAQKLSTLLKAFRFSKHCHDDGKLSTFCAAYSQKMLHITRCHVPMRSISWKYCIAAS